LAIEWLTMLTIVQTDVGLNAGDCVLLLAEIHCEHNVLLSVLAVSHHSFLIAIHRNTGKSPSPLHPFAPVLIIFLREINPGQDSEDPKDAPLSDLSSLPNESQRRLNSHSMA
jgi:hypothetical protein